MTEKLRTAVVGVGHFGAYHADKYAGLAESELVAVCDTDGARGNEIAARHGVKAVADYRDLRGEVEAVSVVVPTSQHHEVTRFFLENGVHALVEKPITDDPEQAADLTRLADERGLVLQVGHVERFRPVSMALLEVATRPLYIECNRIASFRPRGTDVSVILDLMIHDIDLILSIVNAPVERIDAIGAPVLSGKEDIANTRLRFANGCVANVTASRVSLKTERKIRVFQGDSYVSADLVQNKLVAVRKGDGEMLPGIPNFDRVEKGFEEDDPLKRQIAAFLHAVQAGEAPLVGGADGRRAVETALWITTSVQEHLRQVMAEA